MRIQSLGNQPEQNIRYQMYSTALLHVAALNFLTRLRELCLLSPWIACWLGSEKLLGRWLRQVYEWKKRSDPRKQNPDVDLLISLVYALHLLSYIQPLLFLLIIIIKVANVSNSLSFFYFPHFIIPGRQVGRRERERD